MTTAQFNEIVSSRRHEFHRSILLCTTAVALNLACAVLTHAIGLPPSLDALGTILCAALGGYLPGIVTAFATNLLEGLLLNASKLYYSLIDMLLAVCAATFARKGFFKRLPTALLSIPVFFLIKAGLGSPLTWFLSNSGIGGFTGHYARRIQEQMGFTPFYAQLTADMLHEFVDMAVTGLLTYLVLRYLPKRFRETFHAGGWWQAELSGELERGILHYRMSRGLSLGSKLVIVVSLGALAIASAAIVISFRLFKQSLVDERVKVARSLTIQAAEIVDARRVDEYIAQGSDSQAYREVEHQLTRLRQSYDDVEYLYVYQIQEDGCHVVFDLDTPEVTGEEPGTVVEFEKAFLPYVSDLLAGRQVSPIASNDTYGSLLTVYQPVYDRQGVCRCYVGVDFSMDMLSLYGTVFIVKLITMLIGFFILVVAVILKLATDDVILPINTMAYCAGAFAYDSEEARTGNVQRIRELRICTGDEIENLYDAFLKTVEDSMDYVDSLVHARVQVEVMKEQVSAMDELAYKDALTGVRNKTAYDQYMTQKIAVDIARAKANFGIVMIDLNYLKRVNDTYGHERGNTYLKKCCKLVCTVFDHSPVFRVGGDEFVAVLEKDALKNREELIERFKAEMKTRAESELLEPWEKVSAAVGLAVYDPTLDESSEDVFKRADRAMYENKQAMKAVRTD